MGISFIGRVDLSNNSLPKAASRLVNCWDIVELLEFSLLAAAEIEPSSTEATKISIAHKENLFAVSTKMNSCFKDDDRI